MRRLIPLLLVGLLSSSACQTLSNNVPQALASLQPRSGSQVSGSVRFSSVTGGVRAQIMLSGLIPNSEHGLHIHDVGDCSALDAASAGGHFNPSSTAHGRMSATVHHLGDLPSVVADHHGNVRVSVIVLGLSISPGPTSIIGRSVIVHRNPDDYVSQPSGNSGPRDACGVIG